VLNFMEGTRFTPQKHASQQSKYRNLLTPKTGGFGYVVGVLGNRVAQVLDVTIAYPDGAPTFWQFISGQCSEVRVEVTSPHAPRILLEANDEMPAEARQELHDWVDQLWTSKDTRIDELLEAH
jgi:hypothetical protein